MLPIGLLLPIITGLLYSEDLISLITAYALPGIISLALGLTLFFWGRDEVKKLRPLEAMVVVSLSWILIAFLGSLPFMIIGAIASPVDAFFESMSGFTTTGASILTDIEALPASIKLWRGLIQWLGGLGVIVMAVALLSIFLGGPKAGMLLMKGEVPGHSQEKIMPRVKDTAMVLLKIYLILTLAEILLLTLFGVTLYDAICHSFTTLSTGGYSPWNNSIAHYSDSPFSIFIEGVIVLFMLLGSINFVLHYNLFKGNWRAYFKDAEFRVFMGILAVFIFLVSLDLIINRGADYSGGGAVRAAVFQVASISTTTGYATEDFGAWPAFSRFLLLCLMLMGGMTSSTTGSIKIARVMIAGKMALRHIRRIGRPKAHLPLRVGGIVLPESIVKSVGLFVFVFLITFLLGSFTLTLTGLDIVTSMSAVATTLGNVGPGLNIIGPTANFHSLTDPAKIILSMLMWLGRLELVACLLLFLPSTYKH